MRRVPVYRQSRRGARPRENCARRRAGARGRKRRRAGVRAYAKLGILGGRFVSARCRHGRFGVIRCSPGSGRVAMPQYCKLPTACLRSVAPEAFSSSTSTAIREDSGTKTEVSHDEGPVSAFPRGLIFGCRKKPQVSVSLNLRARRGPLLPSGTPRFSCQDLPRRLNFFASVCHYTRSKGSPEGTSLAATMSSGAQLSRWHVLRRA